jgi:GT2 family glycosyltransferase
MQHAPPSFEVLIAVDGGEEPDLGGAVMPPACTGVRTILLGHHQGVSAARNAAIAGANGRVLGFLDDDVQPDERWMTALCTSLDKFDAVSGRIMEDARGTTLGQLRRLAFDHRHSTNVAHGGPVDYLNGGNCGVRTDAIDQAGGFNQAYTKSQDRELARRLVQAGFSIGYIPELVVRHRGSYAVRDLARGRYKAGQAAAAMQRVGRPVAVGPTTFQQTYGGGLLSLARRHGIRLAGAAALSMIAYRAGRLRPLAG